MAIKGTELFVKALRAEGVDTVFGYPGGMAIDLFDALYSANDIDVILPRHEQALIHEALDNPGKRILVLATHITLNQSKFLNLMTRYKDLADIFTLEAPGIVEAVEKGLTDSQEFMDYLKNLLHEYIDNPVDAVVLGCTHYPFVKRQILEALQYTPAVYDGGNGTARETLHQLTMHSIVSHSVSKGTIEFLNSDVKEIELSRQLFAAISKGKK